MGSSDSAPRTAYLLFDSRTKHSYLSQIYIWER